MKNVLATLAVFFAAVVAAIAQNPLHDPAIPNGESIRYVVTEGDEVGYTMQDVHRVTEAGTDYYLVSTHSPNQDVELRLVANGLVPVSAKSVHRVGDARYRTSTEVERVPESKDDTILIIDTNDLVHVLRGYPFENPRELALRLISSDGESEDFALKVKFIKRERIRINGGSRDAYKLELAAEMSGPLALFSRMFPKTFLWYSAESPHYLLRYEGSTGPGGGKIVTEIESYRVP